MSSSGFSVIRKHARDATSIRIKELAQQLARQRSEISGSQLETEDIRSQGRMDHSTIKMNDERLKFVTALSSSDTDFYYELPSEPDYNNLKVWFMLDHLGAKMRDMSFFNNNANIQGHPTLRRAPLNLGFQQTSASFGTPVMLFNSGTDVVSRLEGEYIWIPDNESIQFTNPAHSQGFSISFRFNCLNFLPHIFTIESEEGVSLQGQAVRRFASKTDSAITGESVEIPTDGWNIIVNSNLDGSNRGIVFQVIHDGVEYQKRVTGFNVDTWYQVALTYNPNLTSSDRIQMYVGGILQTGSISTTTLFLPTHPNLRIGARDALSGFFQGYIHDFRVYMDKVLTQTEVTNVNDNEVTIDDIPKGHSFIVQYALVQQPLRSKKHKYHVFGGVKRVRIHKYNVTKLMTRTKTHKYSIIATVIPTKIKTHKFNILGRVLLTKTHKYNKGGVLTVNKTHKFNITGKLTVTKTHKYNMGGLQTQYQRFAKSTTAGSNIVQEITYTSTPQALIVWSDGTPDDNIMNGHFHIYYGFSDGTNHSCVSGISRDNQATSDTFSGHKDDKVIALMDSTVGTVSAEATVSFSANKAIFNWTTNDNRAVYIHTMALWGLQNIEVKTFEIGTTSTGNRTYQLNNSTMSPSLLLTLNKSSISEWNIGQGQNISIGAGKSSSKQFSIVNINEDALATSDVNTSFYTDSIIVGVDDDDSTNVEHAAGLISFGSMNGQFTLNWTNAPSSTNRVFSVLALESPNIDVGIITQPAGTTGSQVINTDTNVNTVAGILVFSNKQTTAGMISNAHLTIGGASSTTAQGLTMTSELDNEADTISIRHNKTGSIIKTATPAATAASSTISSEAAVSAMNTQDQFTLNWTTVADSTARKHHYIVFGK